MSADVVRNIFEKHQAIIENAHVVYTSGRHGSVYVNKDAIYTHTEDVSALCEMIAEHFVDAAPDIVIAPAVGGVILSQWTAHHLSRLAGREVLSVYAEKNEGGFVIKRGYDKLLANKNVLIVEDNLTTGGSVKKVAAEVRRHGGIVLGVGALCNRGGVTPVMVDAPELFALLNLDLIEWSADECPLCKVGTPINADIGKGKAMTL